MERYILRRARRAADAADKRTWQRVLVQHLQNARKDYLNYVARDAKTMDDVIRVKYEERCKWFDANYVRLTILPAILSAVLSAIS